MGSEIDFFKGILEDFLSRKARGSDIKIDREHVIAHATLSAFCHHWPSCASDEIRELLLQNLEIKEIERSRWMTQRRISLAKLSRIESW